MRNNAQLSYQMYHINEYWFSVHVELDESTGINRFDLVCLPINIHTSILAYTPCLFTCIF